MKLTTTQSKLTQVCEYCFQPYPSIDAPKHKDGKCNEFCVNCGYSIHPNLPCEEIIALNTEDTDEDRILIFDPKSGATPDEVMDVLKLFTFQSYPNELKTRKNMLTLFDSLSPRAKRHFQIKHQEPDEL